MVKHELATIFAEARYFFALACNKRLSLLQREKVIRRNLCFAPRWIRGHKLLAINQIEQLNKKSPEVRAQKLLTLESSARAIFALSKEKNWQNISRFLLAQVQFYSNDFATAYASLKQLLSAEGQIELPTEFRQTAIENLAACCMSLGCPEEGLSYLKQIPDRFLSAAGRALLALANQSQGNGNKHL